MIMESLKEKNKHDEKIRSVLKGKVLDMYE